MKKLLGIAFVGAAVLATSASPLTAQASSVKKVSITEKYYFNQQVVKTVKVKVNVSNKVMVLKAQHVANYELVESSKKITPHKKQTVRFDLVKSTPTPVADQASILAQLITYTNDKSAGPTQNYYWENGSAKLAGFEGMKAGDYHFGADSEGRSGVARAILTYADYERSKGSRQGSPLDPPAWPSANPKVAISFALTGRTYHGYLYNRSHSIADSLLGAGSYQSSYNFTTGTRSQNVGANQNGGMRYAEEAAENFWKTHPNTNQTIQYQTTPLYQGAEKMPRGSIVDEKSSDGTLDKEIIVLNDAEGLTIDYNSGSENGVASTTPSVATPTPVAPSEQAAPEANGGWTNAAPDMVYVSDSNRYYRSVVNPNNYRYMSRSEAEQAGAKAALRGNQYARP